MRFKKSSRLSLATHLLNHFNKYHQYILYCDIGVAISVFHFRWRPLNDHWVPEKKSNWRMEMEVGRVAIFEERAIVRGCGEDNLWIISADLSRRPFAIFFSLSREPLHVYSSTSLTPQWCDNYIGIEGDNPAILQIKLFFSLSCFCKKKWKDIKLR